MFSILNFFVNLRRPPTNQFWLGLRLYTEPTLSPNVASISIILSFLMLPRFFKKVPLACLRQLPFLILPSLIFFISCLLIVSLASSYLLFTNSHLIDFVIKSQHIRCMLNPSDVPPFLKRCHPSLYSELNLLPHLFHHHHHRS